MKQYTHVHAIATEVITVQGPAGPCEMQVYRAQHGGLLAIDGSWLEQCTEEGAPCYIPDPYNPGQALQLVDDESEIVGASICGEDNDQLLVDRALEMVKDGVDNGDLTAIEVLLHYVPQEVLQNFLPNGG